MPDDSVVARSLTPAGGPAAHLPRPPLPAGMLPQLLDRLRSWRTDPRFGAAALLLVALVAGLVWYRVGVGAPASARAASADRGGVARPAPSRPVVSGPAPTSTPATARSSARLVVHVAGAVVHPGVVELQAGSRVIDAVEVAGGARPEADLDRLNLAAKLVDGEQVVVARLGDPPSASGPATPGPTDASGSVGSAGSASGAGGAAGPLNLNTATVEQLEALPGIGPSLARAIVEERQRRGGFRSVNELRSVRGIGDRRFADLRARVAV